MTYPTKKYVEAIPFEDQDGYYTTGYSLFKEKDLMDLPDFSAMTDLQKLRWAMEQIGVEEESEDCMGQANVYVDATGAQIDCLMCFDKQGKLIT